MKIGTLQLPDQPVILAPMEDVTDPPFRYMCKKFGADLMFSEFVSSDALIRNVNRTLEKMEIQAYEHPYGIQLYGKNIVAMVESAKITETWGPDLIDINFGCPVKKVAMKGAGAGMLVDVPKMIKMTREIVRATKLPVTVKTRLGWDDNSKNIVEIAEMLQDTGIMALTIHGRTRAQMYRGEADWTLIGEVKNHPRIKIPIIGNGDITDPVETKKAFDRYGVDGIMIGRAAIGRPWIFRDVKHYLKTGEILPPMTVGDQIDLIKEHLELGFSFKDDRRGVVSMRRFFAVSFKGLSNFKETRIRLLQAEGKELVYQILEEIREKWGDQLLIPVPSKEEK
ncbi:MAG: tRNA dihydrouridine synthase DusB [Bacteroidetes bacterium]|jgi:tRNA-dihydrouridine synthase B|nr:tRNA dihydrouridine synthase DusB [Bacteroidota bacterium]MBT4401537.1 tRNA dihydrouridine synthase DusB [Bacteroidota bacterium]MBT4410458.1 tRNA dihydrouridine synthase DusB [Bacteroidota bacterium]MBT5427957.1 tRNA dihydrouridine synthase DusB [Bacteroidota bacterium]MBT7462465.1 tRNA dihydrouridine synthase DusB [Bacteroidota bacterium]